MSLFVKTISCGPDVITGGGIVLVVVFVAVVASGRIVLVVAVVVGAVIVVVASAGGLMSVPSKGSAFNAPIGPIGPATSPGCHGGCGSIS